MIVEFVPGPGISVYDQAYGNAKGLRIELPFSNAANEQEAVEQAATQLQRIGSEIAQLASHLLREKK